MYFIENFYTLSAPNPVQPRCRDVIEEGKHYSDKDDLELCSEIEEVSKNCDVWDSFLKTTFLLVMIFIFI